MQNEDKSQSAKTRNRKTTALVQFRESSPFKYAAGPRFQFTSDTLQIVKRVNLRTARNEVTATVPGSPTGVVAIPGNGQTSIAFTAPISTGGAPIISYTVTSSPGGFTATGATSPIVVTGLTNETAYTFTVVATNSVGNSVASAASTSVTPSSIARAIFTSGSGIWIAPTGVISVDYLVVGGGGGGGGGGGTGAGGGGGGGSVKTGTISVTPGNSYNYTVGAGGTGGVGTATIVQNGTSGGASSFSTITANGGGVGFRNGEKNETNAYGRGGAAQSGDSPTTGGSGGNVRDGGGNPDEGAGGGGGGAGGAGSDSISNATDNNRGGNGGSGIISNIRDNTNQEYGKGGKGADEGTQVFIGTLPGANGGINTGNGGGGGASHWLGNNGAPGGNGGSGIIILKYSI